MQITEFILQHTGLTSNAINATLALLNEGATIPFIARYRKERTGGLDEVQIAAIRDWNKKFEELIQRKSTVLAAIEEQGKLTDELKLKITNCFDTNELEDIYLPFKQKRLTRGEKARKAGLEPLAKMIMAQRGGVPEVMAERFLKGEISDVEQALQGAHDIVCEWMNENAAARSRVRNLFQRKAQIVTKINKGKSEEGEKYRDYFDYSGALNKCPSHRFLAIYRAHNEGIISLKVQPDSDEGIDLLERFFVKSNDACGQMVATACKDAYKRLLAPSLENETLQEAKTKADLEAIRIFSSNLRQLLLAPPLGNKRILAIDPGFRTGCKLVCLDEAGNLLHNQTIYPHPPQNEAGTAKAKLAQLVEAYKIEAIAIGDGTAGRETEFLVKNCRFNRDVTVFVVREDGASIYSASSVARKEFPTYDVTVRGAVSIGRRLMDPLAELVKIDAKSIGVGQYQHEVNPQKLKESLDDVVVSCVNTVGVDLNTASPYLLSFVSGLSASLAENIVDYRTEIGSFNSREELKKVKRLGDKAFEQAAGFLRIRSGKHPLDNSSVHPESYVHVEKMAKKVACSLQELIGNKEQINRVVELRSEFPEIDNFTFNDLISELKKPGRDPRETADVLEFDTKIRTIADLKIGMILKGIVTNVTAFGAFVNIGLKENGLIHKSQLADCYVEDASQFIGLHEHVTVEVLEIDEQRKRIGLKKINKVI